MWYEGAAFALMFLAPAGAFAAYRLGVRDGVRAAAQKPPEPLFAGNASGASLTGDRWDTVLENVNCYNGTPEGQREVSA